MSTTSRPVTHSGYPLSAVGLTRSHARRSARRAAVRRRATWAESALLAGGTAAALAAWGVDPAAVAAGHPFPPSGE